MPYQTRFDLDIPRAIKSQLVSVFEELETEDLLAMEPAGAVSVWQEPGVYGLYREGELVYVGKADRLATRLGQHRQDLLGRQNVGEIRFKAVAVHLNWKPYAAESILLKHYQPLGQCEWNGRGFGNNDPGRRREETDMPPDGFYAQYPIRTDWECESVAAGEHDLLALLIAVKEHLPFTLRYQAADPKRYRQGHPDFHGKGVVIPADAPPVTTVLERVVAELPGWQATAFPSHMILYREARNYQFGEVIARNDGA